MRVAQLRVLGGAMARVSSESTAFAHRQSRIMANLATLYERPDQKEACEAWAGSFQAAVQQEDRGAYVNFLSVDGGVGVHAAYPDGTWDRLTEIKRRYDPTNLFRLNQNIPPGG